ncbi:hypothetical protein [Acinetobacter bereziniae]|uniref:hypothetical protein n=1 Tax=Acinetobacter bereziniae TaxID=106648 RepID=UPI003008A4D9
MKLSARATKAIKNLVSNNENVELQSAKANGFELFYAKASVLTPTVRLSSNNDSGIVLFETLVSPEFDESGEFTFEYKRIEKFANKYFSEDEFIAAVESF